MTPGDGDQRLYESVTSTLNPARRAAVLRGRVPEGEKLLFMAPGDGGGTSSALPKKGETHGTPEAAGTSGDENDLVREVDAH